MASHETSSASRQRQKFTNTILQHAKEGDLEQLNRLLNEPEAQGLEFKWETPLQKAIEGGHSEIVQWLIDQGFSVEEMGVDPCTVKCKTPLHLAVRHNRVEITRILLDANADTTRLDITDSWISEGHSLEGRRTPFVEAAYWDGADVLQVLIERLPPHKITIQEWNKALIDASANRHTKSLDVLLQHYPDTIPQQILNQCLAEAVFYCRWDEHEMMFRSRERLWDAQIQVFRLLLARGADPNYISSSYDPSTVFHIAIVNAKGLETIQMLLDYGADIHAIGYHGRTAFALAVINGNPQIVRFFLEKGGSVHERLAHEPYSTGEYHAPGGSLLHIAAHDAPLETVQLLLSNGANPLTQDENGALPFHAACRGGRIEVVELLWLLSQDQGSSTHLENSVTKDGWTPLLLALCHAPYSDGAISVMSFLIDKGADVNYQTSEGLTALHHACKHYDPRFVEVLLRAGATFSHTPAGDTELHIAMRYAKFEKVDVLLKHGADRDINTPDSLGRTPLSLYVEISGFYPCEDIIDLLVKYGADRDAKDRTGKTIREKAIAKGNRTYDWGK
ncbi:hypothetical protein DTO271G3_4804 [Paecilomyces variotii]|nr:hypothetical protein DTO271G3_4804 [Paecilomyces variotii]